MENKNTNLYEIEDKYENIKIIVKTANIEFKRSENENTKVIINECKRFSHSVKVENETLIISKGKTKWYSYFLPSFKVPKIMIYIPNIKLETLNIVCVSGCVNISSLEFNNEVDIKGKTGKINLEDMLCKTLTINKITGKINMEKVFVKDKLYIKTTTARIHVNESDANEIFIKSNTGNIYGNLLTDKAFVIKCKTGKVNIPSTFGSNKCEVILNTGNIKFEIKNNAN